MHVKYFPEKLSKTLPSTSKSKQKQINCNQEQIIVTTSTKSCNQKKKKKHYKYEQPHKILDLSLSMWILREKKGGRWVGGGGLGRTRTRDGSVRMRDESVEWLACTTTGPCVKG